MTGTLAERPPPGPTTALDPIRGRLAALGRTHHPADVAEAMRAEGVVVTDDSLLTTVEALRHHSVGAGPLEPLLRMSDVTDVLVNGPDEVYVDRGSGLERTGIGFGSDAEVRRLATRIAASVGRRLDESAPFVDARLADGTRVHAVLGTVAAPGTCLSLRVPARRTFSLADCVASGSLTPTGAAVLRSVIESKLAFLVSGGARTLREQAMLLSTIYLARQTRALTGSRQSWSWTLTSLAYLPVLVGGAR